MPAAVPQQLGGEYRADAVWQRLDARDDIVPAGAIRQRGQELTVTVQDSVTVELLENTVLANRGGQPILLSHIAGIERGFEDVNYFRRTNGENVITLRITKRSGENSVAVSQRLRAAIPEIQADMPFALTMEVDQDEGEEQVVGVDLGLAWVGTDLDEEDVFGTDWGDDTAVFSISKSF